MKTGQKSRLDIKSNQRLNLVVTHGKNFPNLHMVSIKFYSRLYGEHRIKLVSIRAALPVGPGGWSCASKLFPISLTAHFNYFITAENISAKIFKPNLPQHRKLLEKSMTPLRKRKFPFSKAIAGL